MVFRKILHNSIARVNRRMFTPFETLKEDTLASTDLDSNIYNKNTIDASNT